MNFTPKFYVLPIICGILIIAPDGRNKANKSTDPATVAVQNISATFRTSGNISIIPAVERIPLAGDHVVTTNDFSTVAWYKNKHWWKKNAPIIGGAAGGGLIGGLAGGGTGAVIGGAVGAGGGYLYKHHKEHHQHHDTQYRTTNPTPNHYEHSAPTPVRQ